MENLYKNKYKYAGDEDGKFLDFDSSGAYYGVEPIEEANEKYKELLAGREFVDILADIIRNKDPQLSDEQKKNIPFILDLLEFSYSTLIYIDKSLLDNDEFVTMLSSTDDFKEQDLSYADMTSWGHIFLNAPKIMKKDLERDPDDAWYLGSELQANQEFINECLESGIYSLIMYSEKSHNKEYVLNLLINYPDAYEYIPLDMKKDPEILKFMLTDKERHSILSRELNEDIVNMLIENKELIEIAQGYGENNPLLNEPQYILYVLKKDIRNMRFVNLNTRELIMPTETNDRITYAISLILYEMEQKFKELKTENEELKKELTETKEINKKILYVQSEMLEQLKMLNSNQFKNVNPQYDDGTSRS